MTNKTGGCSIHIFYVMCKLWLASCSDRFKEADDMFVLILLLTIWLLMCYYTHLQLLWMRSRPTSCLPIFLCPKWHIFNSLIVDVPIAKIHINVLNSFKILLPRVRQHKMEIKHKMRDCGDVKIDHDIKLYSPTLCTKKISLFLNAKCFSVFTK